MAPVLVKSLSRLSRSSLIDLALKWLRQSSQSQPYLACNRTIKESEEEDYLFTPAEDVDELRDIYHSLRQDEKETSKGHIVDRIVDGDWRRGLSLHQLAMVDLAYLEQNDTALRWTALKLVPLGEEHSSSATTHGPPKKKRQKLHHPTSDYPSISPTTFVTALKSEISPLVKAHYHLHFLPPPYDLPILRLYISPHSAFAPRRTSVPRSTRHAVDTGRIIYIALPPSCPYIYISLSASPTRTQSSGANKPAQPKIDIASMKRIILEAIPKALSRPHERWALAPTKLTAKSLKAVCQLRGNGRPGASGGAYSRFLCEEEEMDGSPIDVMPASQPQAQTQTTTAQPVPVHSTKTNTTTTRDASHSPSTQPPVQAPVQLQSQIRSRFGSLASAHPHHAPLDRFTIHISDLISPADAARPVVEAAPITLHFSGSDVFRGINALAELAATANEDENGGLSREINRSGNSKKRKRKLGQECVVDLDKVPSWLTGELGVSTFTV